jgi:hypothetical protein
MYSPVIIATEQAFHPLPSGNNRFNLLLPLQSFSEGNPLLVEIPPCSVLGPIDLNTYGQDSSLPLDSTLSLQTSPPPAGFWSKPNSQERS